MHGCPIAFFKQYYVHAIPKLTHTDANNLYAFTYNIILFISQLVDIQQQQQYKLQLSCLLYILL
jgi:hypothetical protein